MKASVLLFFISFLVFQACSSGAQPGCTDPQALNYDPSATENDGSCTYPATQFLPQTIAILPDNLQECSGLAYFQEQLWTQMDGGNPEAVFSIDTTTGVMLEEVTIPNALNTDWEDLAEDETYLYIGDFGNNSGNRTDLRIYRVLKSELPDGNPVPDTLSFSFSDQTNFSNASNAHNYDCEAFFYLNDSLHLFSKNWQDFKTRHYVMPATPGNHVAQLRDSLDAQGLITGATISDQGTVLLLGYTAAETFLWLLFDYKNNYFFTGNKRRIKMGSPLTESQPEGIAFRNNTYGYICAERLSVFPQKLMAFDIRPWIENPNAANDLPGEGNLGIYPNPASHSIHIDLVGTSLQAPIVTISDLSGNIYSIQQPEFPGALEILQLDVSHLSPSHYVLQITGRDVTYKGFFVKI